MNLNNQATSGRHKTGFWGHAPSHRAKYQTSSTSYSLNKSIQSCKIVPHLTKILQNFLLSLVFQNIFKALYKYAINKLINWFVLLVLISSEYQEREKKKTLLEVIISIIIYNAIWVYKYTCLKAAFSSH